MEEQPSNVSGTRSEESRTHRFRFKRKNEASDQHRESRSRRHRSHSHHRSKRRRSSTNGEEPYHGHPTSELPPDMAFRESLFDALGDDEGAAYWQGVYGQPIHTYPNMVLNEDSGEVETMNDEEYASFVRRKMWEKSWEGLEAAKEERRREAVKEKERAHNPPADGSSFHYETRDYAFDLEVENSLKRGAERKKKRRWMSAWQAYMRRWEELQALHESWKQDQATSASLFLRNKIAWPVESGKRNDVNTNEVERFIHECSAVLSTTEGENHLLSVLKVERVRYHPDKIQQRFSFMNIDANTMQGVTEVFQILDRMWTELRKQPR